MGRTTTESMRKISLYIGIPIETHYSLIKKYTYQGLQQRLVAHCIALDKGSINVDVEIVEKNNKLLNDIEKDTKQLMIERDAAIARLKKRQQKTDKT